MGRPVSAYVGCPLTVKPAAEIDSVSMWAQICSFFFLSISWLHSSRRLICPEPLTLGLEGDIIFSKSCQFTQHYQLLKASNGTLFALYGHAFFRVMTGLLCYTEKVQALCFSHFFYPKAVALKPFDVWFIPRFLFFIPAFCVNSYTLWS